MYDTFHFYSRKQLINELFNILQIQWKWKFSLPLLFRAPTANQPKIRSQKKGAAFTALLVVIVLSA